MLCTRQVYTDLMNQAPGACPALPGNWKRRNKPRRRENRPGKPFIYEAVGSDSVKDRIDPIKSSSESGSFDEPA